MNWILRLFKHSFTGRDNETFDIGRLLWALSVLAYIGICIYAVYKGQQFAAAEFGGGLSAQLAGGGFGVAVKGKTEPGG